MKTKYLMIIVILLACVQWGFAQDKLFDKYAEMEGVTSVYISKAMFRMKPYFRGVRLNQKLKDKVEFMQLISTERKGLIPQMRDEFSKMVTGRHEELMHVRDGKTKTVFYSSMNGDLVKDLVMLVDNDSNFVFIKLAGNFTLKEVQELADGMNK